MFLYKALGGSRGFCLRWMTAKAMVFIQLVRAVVSQRRYRLHFYLDETGQLDDGNLAATTRMAVDCGVMPITVDPDVRIDPSARQNICG